jgi:hypothetical protein
MGDLDIVLDTAAPSGKAATRRIAFLLTPASPTLLSSEEQTLVSLTRLVRDRETEWQSAYWQAVLIPAVQNYCVAEALAVSRVPDPTGLGHRAAGINAAIKGMWYVVGPFLGLGRGVTNFEQPSWNREQQWMNDTSLLMRMIDDWAD